MPTIQANGLELAYQIDGDHPETLVLVNGLADARSHGRRRFLPLRSATA